MRKNPYIMILPPAPKPISFDGRNGYHTQTTYETDSDTGFGFKIQITSDMNIPKNY